MWTQISASLLRRENLSLNDTREEIIHQEYITIRKSEGEAEDAN